MAARRPENEQFLKLNFSVIYELILFKFHKYIRKHFIHVMMWAIFEILKNDRMIPLDLKKMEFSSKNAYKIISKIES